MIDALILCGGLGTRLRPAVSDRPKGLAPVAGRPFLDILVDELLRNGLRRLVFCTGHGGHQIAAHYAGRSDADFVFSPEPSTLGTGGAIRNAFPHIRTEVFFVVNGDSICRVAYSELLAFHERKHASLTIVVTPPSQRGDVDLIALGDDDRIHSFGASRQLCKSEACFVNAGIYVMQRRSVSDFPADIPLSLEKTVFPRAVQDDRCYGFRAQSTLTDIGTPERYRAAQQTLRNG